MGQAPPYTRLWGFVEPPEKMTQTGKDLSLNAVVLAATNAWGP